MLLRPVLMPILRNPLQGIADGIRNMLAELLGSSQFFAPLTHSLVLSRGTGSPTFTRASTATFTDWESVLRTVPSGCARFEGGRMVRNLLTGSSENLTNAVWGNGSVSLVANAALSPRGDVTASKVIPTAANATVYQLVSSKLMSGYGKGDAFSWIAVVNVAGSAGAAWFNLTTGTVGTVVAGYTATIEPDENGFYRWSLKKDDGTSFAAYQLLVTDGDNSSAVTPNGTDGIFLWGHQLEDVTGQADQTASEYVSVGVLSAPYHGAGVDGIEFFNTDRDGALLPSAYTYDAVSLNGVAGTYVSTPDSVAASITGDIDIRVKAAPVSWSGGYCYASKWDSSGTKSTFVFIGVAGKGLRLFHTADGSTVRTDTATAGVSFADGATGWIRVTRVAATGVVTFYESADGVTWTQVGAPVAGVAEALQDNNAPVEFGSYSSGGAANLSGKVYEAQIYNGINGTLAVDFDASRYAGGTTLTGSTGETWTLQGNAVIHPTNSPNTGYLAEGARTNLCLQSQTFTTTWTAYLTPSATQNVIGPDGAVSAWTLTDDYGADVEEIYQDIAITAAAYTLSIFVKKTTGATTFPALRWFIPGLTQCAACTIDTNNGVATAWTAMTGFTMASGMSASCSSYNTDYWRVSLTKTGTAALHRVELFPAVTSNATQSTGAFSAAITGSAVFYGAQVELGSSASTYIATTTAAVTRAADVDANPTASNILAAASTVYLEFTPDHTPSGTIALWGTYVDASNYTAILHDATNMIMRKRIAGVNYDATIANAFSANTTYKVCGSWGASGVTVTVNGTEGTPHANTTAAQIAATMQWGADGNSLQQPFATERNARVWQRQLSASERAAITV